MERVQTRRWASKASWRLTFTVWSIMLLVWAVVTITIDYSTLVVIRDLFGQKWQGPAAALGLIFVSPMLIDAFRNGLRYRRGLRHAQADALTHWAREVPAMTPRKFRAQDGAREQDDALTWRERAIVEQGQLAYGTVLHHGELSSVRYDAPWGDAIGSRPVAAVEPRPREGSRVALLFEPGAHVGVAPTLLGLEFRATDARDARPELATTVCEDATRELTAAAVATLHPVERMSRYRAGDIGELTLSGGKLTLTPASGEPVTVVLDKPFRVELSVFLLPGERAELNVRLEPRTNTAYRAGETAPVVLKTEMPQSRIDRRLPEAWVDGCYLAPEQFNALWTAIVSAADDTSLTGSVALA